MSNAIKIPARPKRRFVNEDLVIDSWSEIKPLFENLLNRKINSVKDLENWMLDRSELEAILNEDLAVRNIKMKIDTTDKELTEKFIFYIQEIHPKALPYYYKLDLKLIKNPHLDKLDSKYSIYLKKIKSTINIFRKENIPLLTEEEKKVQEYNAIIGKMNIEVDGQKLTIKQAEEFLTKSDRCKREKIWNTIELRKSQDEVKLDNLFDDLIILRQQIAKNAGFKNYRDYMFIEKGRFDYTPQDCFDFHSAISKEIVPIITLFNKERKDKLGYQKYKPWDITVDVDGLTPLKPFNGSKELTNKSIKCLNKLNPYFGECLSIMKEMQYLDLESQNGKAPGACCINLSEINMPFIHMNAVGSQADLVTMIHEAGHAIHGFLMKDLEFVLRYPPSEVCELAAMSMEVLSMKHWDIFYSNSKQLKKAKIELLKRGLVIIADVARGDAFQHWVYTNEHNAKERKKKWDELCSEFESPIIDWDGQENFRRNNWQSKLHFFGMPFYYIEYAIAQLGAFSIWKAYKD